MSTHECFERHVDEGQKYEHRARMAMEDATATWMRSQAAAAGGAVEPSPMGFGPFGPETPMGAPHPTAAGEMKRAAKAFRAAHAQQRLAVREYREAVRLRPRNTEVKQKLRVATALERKLEASLDTPKPKPLGRFLAHYNLSIRYWDLGKAKQALIEAEMAHKELQRHGIETHQSCAEHNLVLMEQVHADFRAQERALQDAASPEAEAALREFRRLSRLKHGSLLKAWHAFDPSGRTQVDFSDFQRRCQELGIRNDLYRLFNWLKRDDSRDFLTLQDFDERATQAVETNYRLGELYFDKRMLLKAEAQIRWTLERARAAASLRSVRRDREEGLRASWQQWRLLAAHGQAPKASQKPLDEMQLQRLSRKKSTQGMKSFELVADVGDVRLGISPCGSPLDTVIVGKVKPGSWADASGLRPDDEIVSINGRPVLEFDWGPTTRPNLDYDWDFQRALRERPLALVFARQVSGILADLQDDLVFMGELRKQWCVEEEAGKTDEMQATGVRDGQRPQLLPCLRRRLEQDCWECDAWWAMLCSRTDVDLCAMPSSEARKATHGPGSGGPGRFCPPARSRSLSRG